MHHTSPTISIGLPVNNGELFLEQALDSILAQTFEDFEVILSDNGSNDRTSEIGQTYALQHPQIKYYRQERNFGSVHNFNTVFRLSKAPLFKWHAHDDLLAPNHLESCYTALERHPKAVLAFTSARIIDSEGRELETHRIHANTASPNPIQRFSNMLLHDGERHFELFGLIRRSFLEQTNLLTPSARSERVLLAQLALLGPFKKIEESLFLSRCHPSQARWQHPTPYDKITWLNPDLKDQVSFPEWQAFKEFRQSIQGSSLRWDHRLAGSVPLIRYLKQKGPCLIRDVKMAWRKAQQSPPSPDES